MPHHWGRSQHTITLHCSWIMFVVSLFIDGRLASLRNKKRQNESDNTLQGGIEDLCVQVQQIFWLVQRVMKWWRGGGVEGGGVGWGGEM